VNAPASVLDKGASDQLVSLNKADLQSLQTLPGIGKAVAQKIIDARPFESLQELTKISGISAELLNKIKALISL